MDPSTAACGHRHELLERSVAQLRPHDHVCLIFDSGEEQHRANGAFFQRGLAEGDRCLCVADSGNVDEIAAALRRDGVDVDGASARNALTIATERVTYLAGGAFDPDAMAGVLERSAAAAVSDGFRALRIAGEVTWALGGGLGADRVMEYEARVNGLLPRIPCLALCHYDRRRFSPEVIRDVIRTHPLALVGGRLCRNLYYVPPERALGPDRLQGEIDQLLQNILEREQAEETLRESQRRLALVLEGAEAAYWDWDLAADRLVLAEPWMEALGLGGRRLDRRAWRDRIHPEDQAAAVAGLDAHLAGRQAGHVAEYRVRFADGGWRWVQARGRVVERGPGGEALRMAGTLTDVTDRRALQHRLELSSRLASVGTLAAGVAHEINNPLTFVDANLRWALDQLDGGAELPRAELRSAVAEALDGAVRVREIVQELRRFGQAPQGQPRATADASRELQAAAAIARRQVEASARLRVEVGEGLPSVRVSAHELGQLVVNLLVNAAQAIPPGRAAEHEVRLAAARDGEALVLAVSDTGGGIPPEVVPHIFDPFYTTKQSGTGLGLAICHGIVEAAGGTIAVQSEVGRGTTFRVRLPAAAAPPAPAHPSLPQGAAARRRILIVDDEPLVGRALQRALAGDHEVEVLTTGAEALRRLEAGERWDLLLCDLVMPELTGVQLAEQLERRAPDALRSLVFMTGGIGEARAEGAEHLRRHRCLQKPIAAGQLRALLAER